ncbi:MAG: hypothetical protein L7U62_05930 [Candidatus Poseidoniaceae archaeon]|nr:hypothetical protein [Candidatus Poseidoniaceae archaeon]
MQETYIANCLEVAFKSNVTKARRQAIVVKTPDWQLMEKPWRPLLLLALAETELPAADDDEDTAPRRRQAGGRGRSRRGGRGATGPMDLLPSPQEMLIPSDNSPAFRLAVLMVHKLLNKDDWEEEWETTETSLRETCLEKGVHPVWQDLAQRTALLGQFAAFPKAKVSKAKTGKKVKLDSAFINPSNAEELILAIDSISPSVIDAESQVALRTVSSQLAAGRQIQPAEVLLKMKKHASALSVLLSLASGQDPSASLKTLESVDEKLAEQLSDYHALTQGKVTDWEASRTAEGEHSLAAARQLLAWEHAPDEASTLTSKQLTEGLELLRENTTNAAQIEKVMWWRLNALHSEGNEEETVRLLTSLKLDHNTELSRIAPLLASLTNDELDLWLLEQIPALDDGALVALIQMDSLSLEIRAAAARNLNPGATEERESVLPLLIDIHTQSMELPLLAKIITSDELISMSHPYETLLVSHLLDAGSDYELWSQVRKARRTALSEIHSVDAPESFSSTSEALLMLFEGENIVDERLTSVLDRQGLRAFSPIRQALRDGGSGIASSTHLANLEESVASAELTVMERVLFNAVIATLRLNYVGLMLQHGNADPENIDTLNTLLSNSSVPTGMIHSVRHLVLEHDIGLPSLVRWYQNNDALSPWHTLARAAVYASQGEELNAARDYRKAGDHEEFDYEHSLTLYRKALIHLAFAEQWREAVELLDAQPALKSAITHRFQLYLRVSFTARTKDTNSATKMLKDFVKRTRMVTEENEDGEMVEVMRVYHAEDDLDMLKTYPLEHPRPLPTDPFCGRVTAATNSLHKNRRRQKNTFDMRFNQLMQSGSPSTDEVYTLASEAAKVRAVDGLMFLERAQNSPLFNDTEIRSLQQAEKSLFSVNKANIPNASRRYLRNLSLAPLVIVDTNILVDALTDRIAEKLELVSEASLDVRGQGSFHKILLSKSKEKKLHLWLPSIVEKELRGIASGIQKLKSRFDDFLVSPELLDSIFSAKTLNQLVDGVVKDYNTWRPLNLDLEKEAESPENKEAIDQFLLDSTEIYEEITAMKRTRGEPARTVLNNLDVYPEAPDRTIMQIASQLATQSLQDLGTVLVATRDGDFTLVARAFEEQFGFGIAKNSRSLNAWLK